MALYVRKDDEQNQLQTKIAADLRARAVPTQIHDDSKESTMLEGQHQTRPAGMVILLLLAVAFIVGAAYFIINFGK